jgi:hypothetical protein
MLDAKGIPSALRSKGAMPDAATQVYVADTIGELGTLFRLAPLAFLGKSLGIGPGTTGGQNPIEAIRHGVGVITGPHCANFHEIYQTLFRSNGAVTVTSAATLASEVKRLLTEPAALAELHANEPARWRRCRAPCRRRSTPYCCLWREVAAIGVRPGLERAIDEPAGGTTADPGGSASAAAGGMVVAQLASSLAAHHASTVPLVVASAISPPAGRQDAVARPSHDRWRTPEHQCSCRTMASGLGRRTTRAPTWRPR